VLSREEVRQILHGLRLPIYRVCLSTIYACGLRVQEGAGLQVGDVDSARMVIHVRQSKGPRIATCPCRSAPWRCCGSIGVRIVTACEAGYRFER
jgi:site-specific recombinase XerD